MTQKEAMNLTEGQMVFVKQGWFPWTFKKIVHDTTGKMLLELERIPNIPYPEIYQNDLTAYFSPRMVSKEGKEILK